MGLLSEAKAIRIASNWFHDLPAEQQADMEEFKRGIHAGELPGWSMRRSHEYCVEKLGLTISREAFRVWLNKKPQGKSNGAATKAG